MSEQEYTKVKDPSQPYKLVLGALALVIGIYGLFLLQLIAEAPAPTVVVRETAAPVRLGEIAVNTTLSATLTNTSSTVTSTAAVVLDASSGVQLRILSNVGTADVWLSATTTQLVAGGGGYWLKASSTQVFGGTELWQGAWYAVTKSGTTSTLSIMQL